MKNILIFVALNLLLSPNLFSQNHIVQIDLDNIYRFYNKEEDTLQKNYTNKIYVIPTISYACILNKSISHSIRFSYYQINSVTERYRYFPTVYYKTNRDFNVRHFSLGYGIGKITKLNDFIFHSQAIFEFKSKSKYIEYNTQNTVDSTNGINIFNTDNIYYPRQNFFSLYLKETISHRIYKNLYVGLGLGYGAEYSKFIGNRIVTSNATGQIPYYEVKNNGYNILQMNIFPSISLLYNFNKKN